MQEVGTAAGVLNFVSGPGGAVGDTLVTHPRTRFISFTGSKEVGIHINEVAAKVQPGQIWLKRVVAEMGGKDSIIVDEGVDVEEAARGVLASAFGFQGQKCSACSRAIVVGKAIRSVRGDHCRGRRKHLTVGDAADPAQLHGPGRQPERSKESILAYIEKGLRKEDVSLPAGRRRVTKGIFIRPTDDRRCGPEGHDRAGGDLRTGSGGHQSPRTSTMRWRSPTTRSTD